MKKEQTTDYLAYLLRLWHESGASSWRVTLEDAHTGERIGFANLEKLFAFLKQQTEATNPKNTFNSSQSNKKEEETDV